MLRVGVLVSGGGTNLQAIIDAITNRQLQGVEIVTIVSNRKKAFALERAQVSGIPGTWISPTSFANRSDFDQAMIDHFTTNKVDLVVLAGYLVILGEAFINAYEGRIINIHPSLIPAFCGEGFYGLKVHEEAIKRGVKLTGATVHFVDGGTDTGPIISQKTVEVLEEDTPESLQKRVMEEAEWLLLPEAIGLIAKGRISIKENRVLIAIEERD
jgi:phosphoribosylglycinamide formyltransferase 1